MLGNFDSYEAVKRLNRVGIPEEHASEIIHAIMNGREYDLSRFATTEQVTKLEHSTKEQISALKHELSEFKFEITDQLAQFKLETAEQFARIEQEIALIKKEIEYIKKEMVTKADLGIIRTEIHQVKFDILKWILPFLIGIIIAIFIKK